MKIFFVALIYLSLIPFTNLHAQECEEATTLNWLVAEIENSHPKLLFQRLALDQVRSKEYEAKKIINPELEHFSAWGREFEPKTVYMNETRLWFTWQLAGKRGGRIKEWEKSLGTVEFEEALLKQAILKDVWLNFFRLHQIHDEIKLKTRIAQKLQGILQQYQSRKALSPDQIIEKKIIMMVEDNFLLSSNLLNKEKLEIFELLKEVTGYKCAINKIEYEEKSIHWPSLNSISNTQNEELILSKRANLQADYLKAKFDLAEKKSIPDLRIAPVAQNYQSGNVNVYTYGLSFVFPIPFFDRNQTDRISSKLEMEWGKKQIELAQKKGTEQLQFKLNQYQTNISVLKKVELIENSLEEVESLKKWYQTGRLTLSNIVEFCRQLDETSKNFHIGETILMNNLLDILELQGKINSQQLMSLIAEEK